jgi:nucleotidyltransferase substrate binding protein (TIGR01987 family)
VVNLERKYDNFKMAYAALGKAIATQERKDSDDPHDTDAHELNSAGVIQNFEVTYEMAWKFLKVYLEDMHQIVATSPKDVFRACHTHRFLPETIMNELIQLADARNQTTYTYNAIVARAVRDDIVKHYKVLGMVLERLKIGA